MPWADPDYDPYNSCSGCGGEITGYGICPCFGKQSQPAPPQPSVSEWGRWRAEVSELKRQVAELKRQRDEFGRRAFEAERALDVEKLERELVEAERDYLRATIARMKPAAQPIVTCDGCGKPIAGGLAQSYTALGDGLDGKRYHKRCAQAASIRARKDDNQR